MRNTDRGEGPIFTPFHEGEKPAVSRPLNGHLAFPPLRGSFTVDLRPGPVLRWIRMTDTPHVSMREIAQAAGVSVSAVSLALKNSTKISAARREAIVALAERMGYRRDPRLTELMEHLRTARPQRSTSTIAMLIPELTREQLKDYPPMQGLIEGVREIAALAGFNVTLFFLSDPGIGTRRIRSILLARNIKGVVIAPFPSGVARIDFDCSGLCVATAGYSIVEPRLHRACPNYLQMMDELLADGQAKGYRRIGLIMTYGEGGIGHKLFTSSFLFYQSKIDPECRIQVLPKPMISAENVAEWFRTQKPDAIISSGSVYTLLRSIGLRVPQDVGFASIDVSEEPRDAAGADHRYNLVGREAVKQVLTLLNLNLTGVPENPKTVLVDSHQREGFTLPGKSLPPARGRRRPAPDSARPVPSFRGFLD